MYHSFALIVFLTSLYSGNLFVSLPRYELAFFLTAIQKYKVNHVIIRYFGHVAIISLSINF